MSNWADFKRGSTNFIEEKLFQVQKTATTTDNILNIYQMLLSHHRIEDREIGKTLGISKGAIYHKLVGEQICFQLLKKIQILRNTSLCHSTTE